MSKAMTWEEVIGQVHPEWPSPDHKHCERNKQRIRNAAWGAGYHVYDNGVVTRKTTR